MKLKKRLFSPTFFVSLLSQFQLSTFKYKVGLREMTYEGVADSLRIYVNATNLLTFTGYSGADPEGNTAADYTHGTVQGLDFAIPPQPRQVVFGASLTL